jgi:hypothetical protein
LVSLSGTWRTEVQQGVAGGVNVGGEGYADWPSHGNYGPAMKWRIQQEAKKRAYDAEHGTGSPFAERFKDWPDRQLDRSRAMTSSFADRFAAASPSFADRFGAAYRGQRADDDRRAIDDANKPGGVWAKGAVNAEVRFLNVPPNVKTSADATGDIFRQLQISKTKQAGVFRSEQGYE